MNTRAVSPHEPTLERAALVGLATRRTRDVDPDSSIQELTGLTQAAGGVVALTVVQERASADPATFIGRGKAEALARACAEADVTLVVVDQELTPAQAGNLEQIVGRRVIDRTELILDIFASRARTREGQLQVELAQLRYLLPRLAGQGVALSRLGGGIGTRGPGETKLETDRRRIRQRIAALGRAINHVGRRRGYLRARRRRADLPVVALVGYTNAGKTTLFNRLTGAGATVSDALFVTLDPLMRRVRLPNGRGVLVSDTVGFIDRLPHQLVAAFHATLEEVAGADLLLHVIDASAEDRLRRAEAVRRVLIDVGAADVPVLEVLNKIDAVAPDARGRLGESWPDGLRVSARTGRGIATLGEAMATRLAMDAERVRLTLDRRHDRDRALVAEVYRVGRVVSHAAEGDRVSIEADIPRRWLRRFQRAQVPA